MIANSSLDRFVVDQRQRSRNPETQRTVRASRRKLLAAMLDDDDVTVDLIAKNARQIPLYTVAMIVLVGVAGLIGTSIVPAMNAISWAATAAATYGLLGICMRASASECGRALLVLVQLLQVLAGLCWAWFVLIPCVDCGADAHIVYRVNVLLAAMATVALLQPNVAGAVPFSFGPAAIALLVQLGGLENAMGLAMVGVAVGGLVFFSVLAMRTRATNLVAMRLEREKDALIAELETAKAISDSARHKAEEANLAKSRFLASMSHELRTPLNAILGFSEVMVDELLGPVENETYASYVRDIHGSGKHLLSLINEILDLSRIEANRYPLDLRPHHLAEIAHDAVSKLRVQAQRKGLQLEERFAANLPQLGIDERAILQTVLNLLSNAIKFTPRNGRIVIAVGMTAGGTQYLSVIDNGPGIPKDELPLVLSAFGQGSIALTNAEQGTGLGLAIVQAMMTRHGGRFVLASRLREGTRATLHFPLATPIAADEARNAIPAQAA